MLFILVICGVLALYFIINHISMKDPEPIFGIYMLPGKWYPLKYAIFGAVYHFRKFVGHFKAVGTDGSAGQGMKAIKDPKEMDKPQPLSKDPLAFDGVFFNAASSEDGKGVYILTGCERRQMGICNAPFYIVLPSKGVLCSNKLPDAIRFGAEEGKYAVEGLVITPEVHKKRWTISYNGKMWYQNNPEKQVDVDFFGEWTATSQMFDYDTDLHPATVIRSIAREKWSTAYFKGLKTAHQSHYEQFGNLKCKFKIENENFQYTLKSFRDHSFGVRRDWTLMHRYAFHQIFLENGMNLVLGVICQPCTASVFEAGEVSLPDGEMLPVEWIDMKLYQFGEEGLAPKDYAFRCKAGDEIYTVQVLVEHEATHYYTADWDAEIQERFCKYIVNGVPGRGISEFHYKYKGGRPESVSRNDPEWYQKLRRGSGSHTRTGGDL